MNEEQRRQWKRLIGEVKSLEGLQSIMFDVQEYCHYENFNFPGLQKKIDKVNDKINALEEIK